MSFKKTTKLYFNSATSARDDACCSSLLGESGLGEQGLRLEGNALSGLSSFALTWGSGSVLLVWPVLHWRSEGVQQALTLAQGSRENRSGGKTMGDSAVSVEGKNKFSALYFGLSIRHLAACKVQPEVETC